MSNSQQPAADRAQWIAILEAAAQQTPDEINAEWEWLIDQLGLPAEYFLAVLETVQQERWRTAAKNPKAYVKTVAKQEARKMGLLAEPEDLFELVEAPPGDPDFSVEEELEHLDYLSSSKDVRRPDGSVWRRAEGCVK